MVNDEKKKMEEGKKIEEGNAEFLSGGWLMIFLLTDFVFTALTIKEKEKKFRISQ